MHNHDIIFDNQNKRVGLVSSQCERANGEYHFNNNNDNYNTKYTNIINNTCDNTIIIRFYRIICIIAVILVLMVIILFAYAVRKLRRDGKFLWISLNDYTGN